MSFLRDPFWQFIISTCIAIAGIIIPLLVGFFQSKGGGGSPQMSMSPSSNSSGCWIVPTVIVSIILIFFIVFSGFVFTFISQVIGSSSFPTNMPSSPDQVLNSYCQDIQSGAYQQAYDEYSTKLKSKVTSSQLTQMWADQHLDSCTHNSVVESTIAANTTLSTHDFFTKNITNYSVTLIRDGNNGWKIDNIQQQ